MKAGILTFHNSRNYGAVLQAYALCSVMNRLGVETEIINYRSANIEDKLKLWNPMKNLPKAVLQFIFRYRKKRAFDSFEKNVLKTGKNAIKRDTVIDELNKYDEVIVGSDQVWNEKIIGNDSTYFLPDVNGKKIAYAASVGDTVDISRDILKYIKKYDCVSVREERLNQVLVSQGIESRTCCDPTVLAGVDCFEKITADPIMKEDYVFVFMIWDSPRLLENAKKFAQANGLKIINNKSSLEFFLHCKPEEFLSWIKNASFVFTNSFHGTVFSLLFHKRFVSSICKNNNEKNLRVKELMIYLGCENNIINDENSQIETIKKLDYDMIEKKLQNMREESMIYLKKSLGTS